MHYPLHINLAQTDKEPVTEVPKAEQGMSILATPPQHNVVSRDLTLLRAMRD